MREQTKVLFIVYRTEWWGCLDSLCRQECLKEDTLVYVMPVPYYDRDLGTTKINFAKKHFHPEQLDGELPEGARLVDCQVFSLEQGFERIYIHNPYDNTYFVDSVEAKYYSWNLKPFAKKLIYVPHLVYVDWIPEEFTNCPVYEHVDVIYLADGKAKYSLDVQYDEKVEVVPSGIPKYLGKLEERLRQESQEEQKRNGGRVGADERKRLLCCLSYNNLFYGTEKLIQKLRDVCEYLRGRKDILLIFRPDEDIRARYPWLDETLRKKYAEFVAYFQKNRVGIYDESADLYRAVVKADGVLSFGHPVDYLFGVQGKYVLRLDNELRPIPSDEVRCIPSLWCMTAVEEEDRIELWFVPERTKLICRMVIEKDVTGKAGTQHKGKKASKKQVEKPQVEIVAEVPDDEIKWLNYFNITKIGSCLYLSPYDSESIWKYDLDRCCFSGQCLPNITASCATAFLLYGKYLYLIPRMYPGIIKYDIETEKLEILDGWIEELERFCLPEYRKEPYFIWAVKQEGNMLYMASSKCDVWMTFDMDSDTWQMKSMNLPGRRFVDMVKDGENVWLFPYRGDEVIWWNCVTGESQVVYKAQNKEAWNIPYEHVIDLDGVIVAFPKYADNLLVISLDSLKKREIIEITNRIPCKKKDYLSEYQRQLKMGYQFVKKMEDGQVLAYEYYDGAFVIFNEKLQIKEKIYCRLPLKVVRQQQNIIWENTQCKNEFSGIVTEGYYLPAMIDYFVQRGQVNREDIQRYYTEKLEQ